jgi:ATP-dependent DNA helicase DinG
MWASRAQACWQLWASYAIADAPGTMPKARWLTLFDNGVYVDIEICSSPILASGNLQTTLWNSCFGAVVTSATLAALGNFERFKMRAGTPDNATYTAVPSPFDFNNAVFKVPKKAVDAGNAQAHTQSLIELLPDIIKEPHGKLLLFSSRRQMNEVLEALPGSVSADLLVQGDRSKKETIAQHKQRIDDGKASTLVGLASFAEGLDLPGDYCRHVVIAKIPFAVPDDPIEAALAEWIDAKGGNAFMEISVPDAAIKLVQACGRLLRNERDSGAITLMDNRILRRRYGEALFNSLPL